MMRPKLLLVLPAALALSGCFGGGKAPTELLTLTSAESRPAATPQTAAQGQAITVAVPTLPQALRTNRIPVYVNETTIQYLTGGGWVENPGALFARLLGDTIAARTGRVVLDPSQYSNDPGSRVTGTLVKFGFDPSAMQVVIVYDAVLARSGANGAVVTNRFEAHLPVAEATPAAVAPALNQAANQLAGEVAAWIGN